MHWQSPCWIDSPGETCPPAPRVRPIGSAIGDTVANAPSTDILRLAWNKERECNKGTFCAFPVPRFSRRNSRDLPPCLNTPKTNQIVNPQLPHSDSKTSVYLHVCSGPLACVWVILNVYACDIVDRISSKAVQVKFTCLPPPHHPVLLDLSNWGVAQYSYKVLANMAEQCSHHKCSWKRNERYVHAPYPHSPLLLVRFTFHGKQSVSQPFSNENFPRAYLSQPHLFCQHFLSFLYLSDAGWLMPESLSQQSSVLAPIS